MSSSGTSMVEADTPPEDPTPSPPRPLYNAGTLGKARQLVGVATLCAAMLLTQSALGQSVVPYRTIARSFHVEHSEAQQSWFAAAFSLTVGTFVLPAGRIGDLVGHKSVVVLGYAMLSIWSLIAGLTHYTGSYIFFDVCRAMQGLGCAILLPNALAILGRIFAPGTYAKHLSFSFFAATAPNGFLTGALFTTLMDKNGSMGWYWGFYVMAIITTVLAVLCAFVLPSEDEMRAVSASWKLDSDIDTSSEHIAPHDAPLWQRLDLFGMVTGVTGLVLFNFAFNQALVAGWSTVYVYVLLIVGILFIAVFIYAEGKAIYPLLPTSVFNSFSGVSVLLCLGLGWASFGIWILFNTFFLQEVRGYSALFTVAPYVPCGVAGVVAAFSSAQILGRTSAAFVMLLSLLAFCIGSCIAGNAPVRLDVLTYIASGIMPFGMDMSFPAASIILSDLLPAHQQGTASSIVNTVVNYSIALGLGFAGVVQTHVNDGGANVLKGYRGAFYMGMGFAGAGVALAGVNWLLHLRQGRRSEAGVETDKV
ncbi:related to aminotriazole resistance protein [Sporisorium reilianum f. sp. reilianum]|uniref:Related to aminotriazole resistance protein n=1 Tax=Sporisorium reilianum f. sp. reilianum TaxID=72559 RepID=A0A2N8UCM9_9BASI|nr:related to aminotriazole resistance protein [Sporisorium reilianum f. sp. reilianum]